MDVSMKQVRGVDEDNDILILLYLFDLIITRLQKSVGWKLEILYGVFFPTFGILINTLIFNYLGALGTNSLY